MAKCDYISTHLQYAYVSIQIIIILTYHYITSKIKSNSELQAPFHRTVSK